MPGAGAKSPKSTNGTDGQTHLLYIHTDDGSRRLPSSLDIEKLEMLADLSEPEAALVEAFVPVAVEEGDGFAGFRDNATKTTSLVDRLKAITLPDPDDVEADLRRYVETKERADELDEKIEKTDRLIDEIVYELYGLTDEEIEIVEAAVGD